MAARKLFGKRRYWRVTQGRSVAKILAPDYAAAKRRAAQIGFTKPTSIVLIS